MKSTRLKRLTQTAVLPAPARDAPWASGKARGGTWLRFDGTVDSVQWVDLPGPGELDVTRLEAPYHAWATRLSVDTVLPRAEGEALGLGLVPFHWPRVIRMGKPIVEPNGYTRLIEGGMLAKPGGSFGFATSKRLEGTRLIVAVSALRPRLPRWLYFYVQARLHERATFAFLRQIHRGWLRRAAPGANPSGTL